MTVGSRCDEHRRDGFKQQKRRASIDYVERNRFYQRAAWRSVRAAHLDGEPLCRQCSNEGLIVAAEVVDHIDEISDGGDLLDDSNLQSLCKPCHNSKTVRRAIARRQAVARSMHSTIKAI